MRELPAEPGSFLRCGFIILPLIMLFLFCWSTKSLRVSIAAVVWAGLVAIVARSGWLADFSAFPPRAAFLLLPIFLIVGYVAFSRVGQTLATLPIGWLIGMQSFRIAVEYLIHEAVLSGVAPPQMSWNGLNFDIITGVTAIPVALFSHRMPQWSLIAWNVMGLTLVLWVVGVAVMSLPTPIQQLKPDNVWIAFFPFIWLPTILVASAMTGHLICIRKLLMHTSNNESD